MIPSPFTTQSEVGATDLIDELEETLGHGSVARRVEALRRITDLFMAGSVDYSPEQLSLFDDVFACLVLKIEVSAKAMLASRLAPHPVAPPRIIHTLAFDDAIEVAAPVLMQSNRLSDEALIENAHAKSQAHLLAISRRTWISGAVTKVLIERGDRSVLRSIVKNLGAEISDGSFSTIVERAEGDDELAASTGLRPSVPRHHLLRLIAKASETVREKLHGAHPDLNDEISGAVRSASERAVLKSAAESADVIEARETIRTLHEAGQLDEAAVTRLAHDGKFNEINAALANLTGVPFVTVEAMLIESRSEGLMVLAKALEFPWPAVKAILDMRSRLFGKAGADETFTRIGYERLKTSTARQILRFHRMQQTAGS